MHVEIYTQKMTTKAWEGEVFVALLANRALTAGHGVLGEVSEQRSHPKRADLYNKAL